jgi:transcriptional regulatory protein LEU3
MSAEVARFFQHYSPYLPILDPECSPDQYHARSPFLFWTVISTGARKYAPDPTILEQLGGRVIQLAFSCLSALCKPIHIIEGLLLLCSWPIPINTMFKDISHVLGGAAMQLALQNGLHIFGNRQDFSRTRLWPDENEDVNRARLWAHCLIVFQR